MHVITSKLEIPNVAPVVRRRRLVDGVAESVERGTATLVSGRRGCGKTALAADFCRVTARDIAWLDVDSGDETPAVFVAYLIAALRARRPGFGETFALTPSIRIDDDMGTLASLLVHELLEHPGPPLVVVLDNLHRLYEAAWTTPFLARLLPLLPHDTHVLMLGRGLPPAPLWRLRSKQALSVIEEATMAFQPAEVRELQSFYGRSSLDVDDVLQFTHGRAALVDQVVRDGVGSLPQSVSQGPLQAWR